MQAPGSLGAAAPIMAPGAGAQVVGSMAPPRGMPAPGTLGAAPPITAPPNAALVNALRGTLGAPNTPTPPAMQAQPRMGIPAPAPQPQPMMQAQPLQPRPVMNSPMIGRNMQ